MAILNKLSILSKKKVEIVQTNNNNLIYEKKSFLLICAENS